MALVVLTQKNTVTIKSSNKGGGGMREVLEERSKRISLTFKSPRHGHGQTQIGRVSPGLSRAVVKSHLLIGMILIT